MTVRIIEGDCRTVLATLPDASVQCVVTSPPYFGLRDYGTAEWEGGDAECDHLGPASGVRGKINQNCGTGMDRKNAELRMPFGSHCGKCGARRIDRQIGLESSVEAYVAELVAVFREVRRVLRPDGVVFCNLGDSYATKPVGSFNGGGFTDGANRDMSGVATSGAIDKVAASGLKPKDLIGVPWRVAFALQNDGWFLRSDIIWCLSGGTKVYARTQKGDMPMMLKDLYRLDPTTVKLWNGEKWTQLLGMSRSARSAEELELTLRSGEKIACTPTHQFPTQRGLLRADEIGVGDRLQHVELPHPDHVLDSVYVSEDAAWFCGLYLAEGSRSGDCIQLAGHVKEVDRWERVSSIARAYGGSATRTIDGNKMNIRIHSRVLNALIDNFIGGTNAKTKHLKARCWHYSNAFLHSLLQGYLSGDGHYDQKNMRWRLGFTRNDALASDLRTIAARLGAHLVLNQRSVAYNGGRVPTYRGELRFERSGHHNQRDPNEVVAIGRSRCRYVYDVGVADEPHVFALASGVLTHNSKPNPMPESVRDRPTKAHEYIFLLSKQSRYFWDAEAVKEGAEYGRRSNFRGGGAYLNQSARQDNGNKSGQSSTTSGTDPSAGRNIRSVWTIATAPFAEAHFATFPPALAERCIKAGTSEEGACPACGAPWVRVVEKTTRFEGGSGKAGRTAEDVNANGKWAGQQYGTNIKLGPVVDSTTIGWRPSCSCPDHEPIACVTLDPFAGAGTVALVSDRVGRDSIAIELNPEYVAMIRKRVTGDAPLFAQVT